MNRPNPIAFDARESGLGLAAVSRLRATKRSGGVSSRRRRAQVPKIPGTENRPTGNQPALLSQLSLRVSSCALQALIETVHAGKASSQLPVRPRESQAARDNQFSTSVSHSASRRSPRESPTADESSELSRGLHGVFCIVHTSTLALSAYAVKPPFRSFFARKCRAVALKRLNVGGLRGGNRLLFPGLAGQSRLALGSQPGLGGGGAEPLAGILGGPALGPDGGQVGADLRGCAHNLSLHYRLMRAQGKSYYTMRPGHPRSLRGLC